MLSHMLQTVAFASCKLSSYSYQQKNEKKSWQFAEKNIKITYLLKKMKKNP